MKNFKIYFLSLLFSSVILSCSKDSDESEIALDDQIVLEFANELINFKLAFIENKRQIKKNLTEIEQKGKFSVDLFVANTNLKNQNIFQPKYKMILSKINSDVKFRDLVAIKASMIEKSKNSIEDIQNYTVETRGWDCNDPKKGGWFLFVKVWQVAGGVAACTTGPGCVVGAIAIADAVGGISDCDFWD